MAGFRPRLGREIARNLLAWQDNPRGWNGTVCTSSGVVAAKAALASLVPSASGPRPGACIADHILVPRRNNCGRGTASARCRALSHRLCLAAGGDRALARLGHHSACRPHRPNYSATRRARARSAAPRDGHGVTWLPEMLEVQRHTVSFRPRRFRAVTDEPGALPRCAGRPHPRSGPSDLHSS